jgi:hypothetical protein
MRGKDQTSIQDSEEEQPEQKGDLDDIAEALE